MKNILFFLFCMISFSLQAAVYESQDSNGRIVYSDTPSSNAKQLDIPTSPAVSVPVQNKKVIDEVTKINPAEIIIDKNKKKPYTSLTITSPVNEQTFQNQRDIPVEVTIEPKLQKGDMLQLMLDGLPRSEPSMSTTLHILQADRGSHQVSVALINEKQQVIKQSNSVTIFVMYAHVGTQ